MKLWQKNYTIDKVLESFTVGIDYQLDKDLVLSDCMASIAHARTIAKLGILTADELGALESALREIAAEQVSGTFEIHIEDEDCHTAIEQALTRKVGDAGKKIHTGRSRNDQILTALRLYEKSMLLSLRRVALTLVKTCLDFATKHEKVPMPGRTHMQIGMPSSLGLWASSLASQIIDDISLVDAVLALVDRSPLGAAAGYGVPLDLDREFSARTMGFSSVHLNVIASQSSRGKTESVILDVCEQLCLSLSKFAQDLILFTLPELGYFSLPVELTSGSSIMPQKKNPDGLELLRSRTALVSGWAVQVKGIIRSLPSGYNRDFQDTKEPLMRGLKVCRDCLTMMELTFRKLVVHPERLRAALTPDLYATDEALRLVAGGMAFRDAYRHVGTHLEDLAAWDADRAINERRTLGSPGNPGLAIFRQQVIDLDEVQDGRESSFAAAIESVLGPNISLTDN